MHLRHRFATPVFAVILAVSVSTQATSQVFVRTFLDRPVKSDSQIKVSDGVQGLPETDFIKILKRRLADNSELNLRDLTKGERRMLAEAILNERLKGLAYLSATSILATCNGVSWALTNTWLPVKWNPARSVCFWSQPGFDWLGAAQIAGGNTQGTASVEIASDVFWGLRVRIQSGVAGTSGTDADSQAKAALKQLQTSGGNVSIGGTYPLYAYESAATVGEPPTSLVSSVLTSFIRVGGAIPALGGNAPSETETIKSSETNGSAELALFDSETQIQSFKQTIDLVLLTRGSIVDGTQKFNESVGNSGHKGFMYGQIGVGLRFQQSVWIIASRTFYSHTLPGEGMTYTVIFGK